MNAFVKMGDDNGILKATVCDPSQYRADYVLVMADSKRWLWAKIKTAHGDLGVELAALLSI